MGTPNNPVFSCVFEKSEMLSSSGSVNGRRVTVYRSDLVELFGLITCVRTGLGQVAKLLGARADVRSTRAFYVG